MLCLQPAGAWFSTGFAELSEGSECFVSRSLKNGYIVQVAPVSEYGTYADFQNAIRALSVEFDLEPTPSVRYTTLDGVELTARYGGTPTIDGKPVDYSEWKLFDGPFAQAERESQTLQMIHGQERYFLDFKNSRVETSVLPE